MKYQPDNITFKEAKPQKKAGALSTVTEDYQRFSNPSQEDDDSMFDHLKQVEMEPPVVPCSLPVRGSMPTLEEVDVDVISQKSQSYRAKQGHVETVIKP